MAGTILVKDAIWRISSLLQDVSPQFTRWPEKEIVNWLNDAHLAITKFLPAASSRVDAIKLVPGTRQSIESIAAASCKPGDGSTPAAAILGTQVLDVIRNMGADGLTPGNSIRLLTDGREVMDSLNPGWHSITGTAVTGYMYDPRMPRYFYVTPGVPATPDKWAEVAYTAQPIAIPNTGTAGSELYLVSGVSTTKISVNDEHIDDLVNYVCARAFMKNATFSANGPAAANYTALFTGSLNAKVTALTGNNPNLQRLPFAPEPIGAAS
jgi:hypothetical protein